MNVEQIKASVAVESAIIAQLGGPQIFAMAFRHYLKHSNGQAITLHVAKGLKAKNRIDRVTIELRSDDTYNVTCARWNRKACDLDSYQTIEMVYGDQLRSVVETETGLRMKL